MRTNPTGLNTQYNLNKISVPLGLYLGEGVQPLTNKEKEDSKRVEEKLKRSFDVHLPNLLKAFSSFSPRKD